MRCRTAQSLVISALDGEVAGWRRRGLDRHLAGCEPCRAARASSRRVWEALGTLAFEKAVPPRLEQDVLRSVRKLAADEADGRHRGIVWLRPGVPMLATGAVALLAIVLVRGVEMPKSGPVPAEDTVAQRPVPSPSERTLAHRTRKSVPDEPPAELAARPELFMDLPMLRNLDKLQHFDSIATTDVDDGGGPDDAEVPSNG